MSWVTKHLNERTQLYSRFEREHPYVVAMLLSKECNSDLVYTRARNWTRVREAEILKPDVVAGRPYHMVLDPSSVCNLRCPLCVQATDPQGRPRALVDRAQFKKVLVEMSSEVIRLDLFNWGEPFLHPGFTDLCEMAGSESLYVRTSTHMSHERLISWPTVVASDLKYIVASIDGATQQTYEKYRVGGQLEAALANLRALVKAKQTAGQDLPLVEWQYLVNRFNQQEIEAAEEIATDIGVDVFRYGGARGTMSLKTLVPSADLYESSSRYLLDGTHPLSEYDAHGEKRHSSERAECRWLWGKIALHADGGVSPCWNGWFARDDIANWYRDSVAEIWNALEYQHRRRAVRLGGRASAEAQCETCAYYRNYVPTPDTDTENPPTETEVEEIVKALSSIGRSPGVGVRQAACEGMKASVQ
jgi:MoaA/NifB/PqqE/SkfB family radical SAM enzyme